MNVNDCRNAYIERMTKAYLNKNKFEVKKVDYGNPLETLKRISPNTYNALKRPS